MHSQHLYMYALQTSSRRRKEGGTKEEEGGGGRKMGEPPDFLHRLQEEVCTCGVCTRTCQQPRALPCLHTFCSDCLGNYIQDQVS